MTRNTQFRAQLAALLPRLRRFGHSLTGSVDEADDLLQDALEKALRREDQYEQGTRLDSWMYRIMQTTWIDRTRSAKVRSSRAAGMEEADTAVGEDGRRSFPARIELEDTRRAMASVPAEFRAALSLVAIEGLTYREAADVLGVPIGTIMSRVARARQLLVEMLQAAQPPGETI